MTKTKLLITDGLAKAGLELLEKSNLFEITFHKSIETKDLIPLLPAYQAIVIRSATKLKKELLEHCSSMRAIMRAGAGVDNIDVTCASQKKILVFNTPGANNLAVAELTIGFMFAMLRFIPRATNGMKQNLWEKKELEGFEVSGRTLGIIGLGAIGKLVAERAQALGMKLISYDPASTNCASPEEVFQKADIVSLHMPLNEKTKNSIGWEQFQKMKKGSYFVNCARGGIVKENDLLRALQEGILAGAAMDVFEQEPPPANHPLVQHPNFICTPHIGAATKESQTKVAIAAAHGLINYFKNGETTNAVNKNL